MAKAFQLGKQEAAAVSNLMARVPSCAVEFLAQSVKSRGMWRYIAHEVIGKDLLNETFTSGINGFEHWRDQLRNTEELATSINSYKYSILFAFCALCATNFMLVNGWFAPRVSRSCSL